jgi:hypothetical protein
VLRRGEKGYEVNQSFPEVAQTNERGLFAVPPGVPTKQAQPAHQGRRLGLGLDNGLLNNGDNFCDAQ